MDIRNQHTKVRVKVFRAINDRLSCEKFLQGHMDVLKVYGVTQITTASDDWFYNPNVYVILVESFEGVALGGVRIHVAHLDYPLPLELATHEIDTSVQDYIKNLLPKGTGEVCGLWNAKEVAGMGIGTLYLMRAAISIIGSQIKIKTLLALCAEHTKEICVEKGFETITVVGQNGTFYYPKDDLIATAMILTDTVNVPSALLSEREYIQSLRKKPVCIKLEETKKGLLELHYHLILPHEGYLPTIPASNSVSA